MACDENVIRDMDKDDLAAYSQALLDCSCPRRRIAACPLAFGEAGVKERVKGILNYRKPAFWVIVIAIVVCIVLAVCLMTDPFSTKGDLTIRYELGDTAKDFIRTPSGAKAGDTVEIRTEVLYDADLHVYVDGLEIGKSHYDSDYWGYSFEMPDRDVTVTARFYTKAENGWNVNTTYTLLRRCIDKGALERSEPGFLCRPLISKEEVQRSETDRLITKVFDGSADKLFAALLGRKKLSPEEIEKLKAIIGELE